MKDRQIFDASRKYNLDFISLNAMTSTLFGSKLKCEFGTVRESIPTRAYNLWISYPADDIVVHTNDVKSCL